MKLVVALGNPGTKYQYTRHNIAWLLLRHLSFADELSWKEKFSGEYAQIEKFSEKFCFLRPMTFMNLSGESVLKASQFFKIEVEDIIVIHDEIDLDFGVIAFKVGGGLAGHNGLKSIHQNINSSDFVRLRLGVGRPEGSRSVSDHVLTNFDGIEGELLHDYLDQAAKAVEYFMKNGILKTSNKYSKKQTVINK